MIKKYVPLIIQKTIDLQLQETNPIFFYNLSK